MVRLTGSKQLRVLKFKEVTSSIGQYLKAMKISKFNDNSTSDSDSDIDKLYRQEPETPSYRGADLLRFARHNKDMAFSIPERQMLGIHGLLPPAFESEKQQVHRVLSQIRTLKDDLAKYIVLDSLQDSNEKLYYRVISENITEFLPIVYTPTVGLACQTFGHIFRKPKGIYITINDNSIAKIYKILSNWPVSDVRAIVVTDGERILGLGDLGAYGMGIPIGKLALYSALGGVQPKWCLPILLDVGTDREELLKDLLYTGLRHKRIRGEEYDKFIDNFMKACIKRFQSKILIQFEDFGNVNAARLLEKYRHQYSMFNDDIQGTGSVVIAGLLSCANFLKKKMCDQRFLFLGAGSAAIGIADLCVKRMQDEGLSLSAAEERIFLINSKGLITFNSPIIKPSQRPYAKNVQHIKDLLKIIKTVKPTGLIGVSTVYGAFSNEVIRTMAEINEHPIIFALSNPTSKSECTAEDAYKYSDGRVLFASGSPFSDVELNGKTYKPGQCNNSYIFPGVGLGVVLFQVKHVDDEIFLLAAKTLSSLVSENDTKYGRIYPSPRTIPKISIQIALEIGKYAYEHNLSALYPKPTDMEKYVRSQVYSLAYDDFSYKTYSWPSVAATQGFPVPSTSKDKND